MKHKGIDGLLRRPPTEEDPIEEDNHEDWIDHVYSFGIAILNERTHQIEVAGVNLQCQVYRVSYAQPLKCLPDLHAFIDIVDGSSDDPAIPRTGEAQVLDNKLAATKQFLITHQRPNNLSDEQFEAFVNQAAHFFILEGNLWCREPHGKHQLVVQPHKHYHILKEAVKVVLKGN
jgi:hypothetical protein